MLKIAEPTWSEIRDMAKREDERKAREEEKKKELTQLDEEYNNNLTILQRAINKLKDYRVELTANYEAKLLEITRKYGKIL
jgi:UDP-N-acetylmuramyl pentapeptide synthase